MKFTFDTPPSSLMDQTMSLKVKTVEGKGVCVRSLQHFEGRGVCWNSKMGTRKIDKQLNYLCGPAQTKPQVGQYITKTLQCMDEPRANTDSQNSPWFGLGGSHHPPPYNILCASPWDQHLNVILSRDSQITTTKEGHIAIQISSQTTKKTVSENPQFRTTIPRKLLSLCETLNFAPVQSQALRNSRN